MRIGKKEMKLSFLICGYNLYVRNPKETTD